MKHASINFPPVERHDPPHRLPQAEEPQLGATGMTPQIGHYRHYNGDEYIVLGVARMSNYIRRSVRLAKFRPWLESPAAPLRERRLDGH